MIFFSALSKRTHPHVAYSKRFFPSTRKRFNDTITIASLTERALYDVRHTSVFVRPLENDNPAFSKISTLGRHCFKEPAFWCLKTPLMCERRLRRPFSKKSGYVWTALNYSFSNNEDITVFQIKRRRYPRTAACLINSFYYLQEEINTLVQTFIYNVRKVPPLC